MFNNLKNLFKMNDVQLIKLTMTMIEYKNNNDDYMLWWG